MTIVPFSLSKPSDMLAKSSVEPKVFKKMLARFDGKLLSSLGASKGGVERAKSLTSKERRTIAQNAAKARWK